MTAMPERWDGTTYHGRPQLKKAPFDPWLVGGYIFLAGLSGSASLVTTLAARSGRRDSVHLVRRGRAISLLAPVLGAPLLVWDLHTPKRFYNMLRVAKGTSPMSIGTWILLAFTGCSALAYLDRPNTPALLRGAGRWGGWMAAASGAGLCTYTASLLAATSTPFWAAAPRALATRFAASSVATGAAALAIGEPAAALRQRLDALSAAALGVEAVASVVMDRRQREVGVAEAAQSSWGLMEEIGGRLLGIAAPLALHGVVSAVDRRRRGGLAGLARWLTLAGSLAFRVSVLGVGGVSALRPDVSFRFSERRNLPKVRR